MGKALDSVVKVGSLGLIDSDFAGETAARKSGYAADAQRSAQERALNYQIEQDKQPSYYRQRALDQLGSFYGMPTYEGQQDSTQYDEYGTQIADLQSQVDQGRSRGYNDDRGYFTERNKQIEDLQRQQGLLDYDPNVMQGESIPAGQGYSGQGMIDDVMADPFYGSMIQQGEDAASRLASQQGLRRSGNLEERYVQNSQNVLQSLVNQRLQGLTGMANLPSDTNAIAGGMTGIGTTEAQGIQSQAQIEQQANQNAMNLVGTIGGGMLAGPMGASVGSKAGSYTGGAPSYQAPATNPMQNYYGNVV